MGNCQHIFLGCSDGVDCVKCGVHMSAKEYIEYSAGKNKAEKPKRQTRKKVNADE